MRKLFFFSCIFCFVFNSLHAQYATSGTGAIRDHIWWFDWAGFTVQNGATRTFNTSDGMTVTIVFSAVSGSAVPDRMNTWYGAVLYNLYDFTDPAVRPALHSLATSATVRFTMTITATRNGVPVPFSFIAGDAEASFMNEVTRLTTSGGAWNRIENFNNSSLGINPVVRCNTTDIEIMETYGGSAGIGQNPLMASSSGTGGLVVTTSMERRTGVLGGMAVAFGIMAPVDRGDLPASYGYAQHRLSFFSGSGCNYPANPPALQQSSLLYIGNTPGDPDAVESGNDNAKGADEDGVTLFPDYNGSTNQYSFNVAVRNTSAYNVHLTAWIDINRDGVFSASEAITKVIAINQTTENFTWLNLPDTLPPSPIGQQNFAVRLRIATNQAEVQSPAGLAQDGEVEDYFFPIVQVCLLSKVNAGADQSVCLGNGASLQASGAATYNWVADGDLSSLVVPDPVATPAANKTYYVTGRQANGCLSKDTISVTVTPPPVFTVTPEDTAVCKGAPVSFRASGGDKTDWLDRQDSYLGTGNTFSAQATVSTFFRVAFTHNRCNMRDTIDVPVTVTTAPQSSVTKSNDLDCSTGRALLTAFGGNSYQWQAGPGIADPTRSTQWVTPDSSMYYYVKVSDQWGCSGLDSVRVNVSTEAGGVHYQMPTAFTPNGDGKNDCFGIKFPGLIRKLDFTIYDRWGQVMFHTNSVNDCWDGTFKGVPMDINTYVYVYRIESPCGPVERKGTITLLR